jgi:hypothetical protein
MKAIITTITLCLLAVLFWYGFFAFIMWNLNPATWINDSRFVCGCLMAVSVIALLGAAASVYSSNN